MILGKPNYVWHIADYKWKENLIFPDKIGQPTSSFVGFGVYKEHNSVGHSKKDRSKTSGSQWVKNVMPVKSDINRTGIDTSYLNHSNSKYPPIYDSFGFSQSRQGLFHSLCLKGATDVHSISQLHPIHQ